MKKKILKLALLGFVLGMLIGNLIAYSFADKSVQPLVIVSSALIRRTGSVKAAMITQTLLSGLLGAISFAGTVFYDPELFDWGMTRAVTSHYLLVMSVNIPIAYFCGWFPFSFKNLLIWIAIMTFCYFIIWLIMFLRYRKETNELNEILKRK